MSTLVRDTRLQRSKQVCHIFLYLLSSYSLYLTFAILLPSLTSIDHQVYHNYHFYIADYAYDSDYFSEKASTDTSVTPKQHAKVSL